MPAACGSDGDAPTRPRVVATTTQLGDWARELAGERVRRSIRSCGPTPTRTTTSRARTTSRRSRRPTSILRSGGDLDRWVDGAARRRRWRRGRSSTSAPGWRPAASESGEPDPHWWHDPRNAERAVRAHPRGARAAAPEAAQDVLERAQARYVGSAARGSTATIAACMARRAARRSASSSPTTTRSGTSPRATTSTSSAPRSRRARRIAQPSAGRARRARRHDRARARARGVPGELGQLEGRRDARARDRRHGALRAVRRHARAGRLQRATRT